MSYVVEVVRPIKADELIALAENDPELTLLERNENWLAVSWRSEDEEATFELSQGRVSVTSPIDKAWEKAHDIAARLGAEVLGEADQSPSGRSMSSGRGLAPTLWLGWPILAIVLAVLLAWKW